MKEHAYGIIPFHTSGSELRVFLIHQYGSGGDTLWTFPKGRPDEGETPMQTALRECFEETGMRPTRIFENEPLSSSYTFMRNGEQIEKTSTYYIGIFDSLDYIVQEKEVKEAGWFTVPQARACITFPEYEKLLDTAVAILR